MLTWNEPLPLLWLLPTFLLSVLWIRTPVFVTATGKRLLMWLKISIILLLVLALLNPRWESSVVSETRQAVFVVDVSPSIDPAEITRAFARISSLSREFPENIELRAISFAQFSHPAREAAEQARTGISAPVIAAICKQHTEAHTDIGSALLAAHKEIEPGRRARIFLFSDGQDLGDKLAEAVQTLAESNIPVTTFPLEPCQPSAAPQILRVVSPDQCFIGDEIVLQVLLNHPLSNRVHLVVLGSDGAHAGQTLEVEAGMSVASFSFQPNKIGPVVYTCAAADSLQAAVAAVRDGGTAANVSTYRRTVLIRPVPKALLVERTAEEGRFLQTALANENIDHTSIAPGSWPAKLEEFLEPFPCIVLNNIPAEAFQKKDLQKLRALVQEGTGLLMLGGPHSFGLGDYTDTPIEEALPVRMPKRTITQGMALVLVLDASGSMSGDPWTYLIQATKEIVRLCQGHLLGIILFNHQPSWVLPLTQITDPEPICKMLDYAYPSGGTVFSLPMAEALWALKDQPVPRKNVIMMSDGVPADKPFIRPLYGNFRDYGVEITTIAAGHGVNPALLKEIAHETNGKFYASLEFSHLPELFKQEFERLSGPPVVEKPFQPVLGENSAILRGITQREIPDLDGLVITVGKPGATMLMTNPRGDPLLAVWRFGLGRGAALTTDLLPAWSRKWADWDGFGKLLRQLIKELSSWKGEVFQWTTTQRGQHLDVFIEAGPQIKQQPETLEFATGETRRQIPLKAVAGRAVTAMIRNLPPGVYHARILGPRGVEMGKITLAANASEEYIPQPINAAQLGLIAARTGGEALAALEDPIQVSFPPGVETRSVFFLWPYLVIGAMLLYLVDICLRRANVFGITKRAESKDDTEQRDQIFLQLAQRFSNLAEEHSLRGEEEEAKQFYLRAKAFYLKAQATQEANRMWDRYKRFEP